MTETLQITFDETSPEAIQTQRIFGVEGEDLKKRMQALAEVAFEECLLEVGGTSISTIRGKRELRLHLLYKHFQELGGLNDRQVGELFQLTRSQVSTLIDGTRARFRSELEENLNKTVESRLKSGKWDKAGKFMRVKLANSLARYVREKLDQADAPPVKKVPEMTRTYELSLQTVRELLKQLGVSDDKEILPQPKGEGKS